MDENRSEHCKRCDGLLIPEITRSEDGEFDQMHCYLCGTLYDPTIEENKKNRPSPWRLGEVRGLLDSSLPKS